MAYSFTGKVIASSPSSKSISPSFCLSAQIKFEREEFACVEIASTAASGSLSTLSGGSAPPCCDDGVLLLKFSSASSSSSSATTGLVVIGDGTIDCWQAA